MKQMTVLGSSVTLSSALNDSRMGDMDDLAEAIVDDMNAAK